MESAAAPTKPDGAAHAEAVAALKAKISSGEESLTKASKSFDHERKVLMGFKAKFDEEQEKFVVLRCVRLHLDQWGWQATHTAAVLGGTD